MDVYNKKPLTAPVIMCLQYIHILPPVCNNDTCHAFMAEKKCAIKGSIKYINTLINNYSHSPPSKTSLASAIANPTPLAL